MTKNKKHTQKNQKKKKKKKTKQNKKQTKKSNPWSGEMAQPWKTKLTTKYIRVTYSSMAFPSVICLSVYLLTVFVEEKWLEVLRL